MKNKVLLSIALCFFCLILNSRAQTKGMYVELFGNYILPNSDPTLKANVIKYAKDHSFNYLLLYDIGGTIFSRTSVLTGTLSTQQEALRDFIIYAKLQIPGLKIGVADGVFDQNNNPNKFFDNIKWYNSVVNDLAKSIDVIQLEYEYWKIGTEQMNNDAFVLDYIPMLQQHKTYHNYSIILF